jgi:hypothetical protein
VRRLLLPAVAAAALLAAGCGGGSPATKEGFDAKFRSVCDKYVERAQRELGRVEGNPTATGATPLQVARFGRLIGRVATLFGEQLDELRTIQPPADQTSGYHEFLRLYGQAEGFLNRAARAARKGDRTGLVAQLDGLDALSSGIDALGFQCG